MRTRINTIIDRITRHPMLQDISKETVVDLTMDFIKIVGNLTSAEDKTACINIKSYKSQLPKDLESITAVEYLGEALPYITSTVSGDLSRPAYKVSGSSIFTTMKEAEIKVHYKAFDVDEDGIPYIDDDPTFLRALESYIKKQKFAILFDLGKINISVYNNAEREYAFNVAQYQNKTPSIDEMETIVTNHLSLPDRYRHSKFFN